MDAPPAAAWTVPPEAAGERLDRHLALRLDVARNQVARWIAGGRVAVDGRPATKASLALRGGERIDCAPPPPAGDGVAPEAGELRLLAVDADLIVVDKPPGLTVHPGAGRQGGTLVNRLLARFPELAGVGGPGRPGIVHRLDRDTSGVLAIARHADAYAALTRAFAARRVTKRYLAIVWGTPPPTGAIAGAIGRHPTRRREMAVVPHGRPARTTFHTLAAAGGVALVEVRIETGRTHQIRVHFQSVHHPLVGDPVYGTGRRARPGPAARALAAFPRPALHAWRLAFTHPGSGERAEFEAPVPEDLKELWRGATGAEWPAAAGG